MSHREATQMAKYAGRKVGGSHTTAIPAAVPFVNEALRRPEVKRVILGPITSSKSRGAVRIKTTDIGHGLKCTVTGNTSVQVLFVYTSDRHATASALHAVAPKKRGKRRTKKVDDKPEGFVDPFPRNRK